MGAIKAFAFWLVIFLAGVLLWQVVKPSKQSQAPVSSKKVAYPDTAPLQKPVPHIVSVSPDSVKSSNGIAWISEVRVGYTIPFPERVTKAELQLYDAAGHMLARTDVPIRAQDEIRWNLGTAANIGRSRYLEVKLTLQGEGFATEDTFHLSVAGE